MVGGLSGEEGAYQRKFTVSLFIITQPNPHPHSPPPQKKK